jgi:hypothetical protein
MAVSFSSATGDTSAAGSAVVDYDGYWHGQLPTGQNSSEPEFSGRIGRRPFLGCSHVGKSYFYAAQGTGRIKLNALKGWQDWDDNKGRRRAKNGGSQGRPPVSLSGCSLQIAFALIALVILPALWIRRASSSPNAR